MREARIPMLSLEEAVACATEIGVSEQLASLNVFRVLLIQPRVAKAIADVLLELLAGQALEHRLRELVIMRIGWATGSDYEWTQHWRIGVGMFGLDPDDVLAVRDWTSTERFSDPERAVLAATDETLSLGRIAPTTLQRCRSVLGSDAAVVELVLAIGTWRMIAELTCGLEIPVEDGVASWPPDGVAPS